MARKKILVLGYFGRESGKLDGQTVKTRSTYAMLQEELAPAGYGIDSFDTEILKKGRWRILGLFRKLLSCKTVVYLPAQNNLEKFFPVLYRMSGMVGFDILYIVIGGWLDAFLKDHPGLVPGLSRIRAIFPENKDVIQALRTDFKMSNVVWLPNFRICRFKPDFLQGDARPGNVQISDERLIVKEKDGFRLVFMSRIFKEKGVETVFEVVDRLNAAGSGEVTVDFYGQVETDYEERFQELLGRCPHAVFKGSLEPGKVVETLAGYDLLLLPTFYPGEGFPGAIVEAGLAGIPVAVSLWKHNIEYVKDGETGFLIPLGPGETDAYADCIRKLRTDRDLLLSMRKKAYQESRQYTAEAVWPVLRPYVEGGSQGH